MADAALKLQSQSDAGERAREAASEIAPRFPDDSDKAVDALLREARKIPGGHAFLAATGAAYLIREARHLGRVRIISESTQADKSGRKTAALRKGSIKHTALARWADFQIPCGPGRNPRLAEASRADVLLAAAGYGSREQSNGRMRRFLELVAAGMRDGQRVADAFGDDALDALYKRAE